MYFCKYLLNEWRNKVEGKIYYEVFGIFFFNFRVSFFFSDFVWFCFFRVGREEVEVLLGCILSLSFLVVFFKMSSLEMYLFLLYGFIVNEY